jgi:hypothetical protein
MPFNSESYYRNKWRRDALERLAEARRLKLQAELERDENGRQWALGRVSMAVRLARSSWRCYQSARRFCELSERSAPYRPAPWRTRP